VHGARDVASVGAVVSMASPGLPLADADAEARAWAALRGACTRRLERMDSQLAEPGAVEDGAAAGQGSARLRGALRLHLSERRRLLLGAAQASAIAQQTAIT
jgi:hypothetical protein